MDIIDEKSTYELNFSLRKGTTKITPTKVTYQVDDVTSGVSVIAATDIYPSSSTFTITIPASANAIHDSTMDLEEKLLTVTCFYGTLAQRTKEFRWKVQNLSKIS